jgi:small subunit ribosomal protein S20
MKTYMKQVTLTIDNKDKGRLDEALTKAVSYIKKAASKGVIHRNNAARKVSRLTKKVNAVRQPKA